MKRYHEAPISIFHKVQELTDGDYALVHLFDTDPEYFQLFKDAVAQGRDVILDNSLFELRKAFDPERYVYWIKQLKPTWIIVPDSWKNSDETVKMFFDFLNKYPEVRQYSKIIGVAQGNNVEDTANSYLRIEPFCDKVAFNFDFSSHCASFEGNAEKMTLNEMMSWGRYCIILQLLQRGVINTRKPHHLLGCGTPDEAMMYPCSWSWLDSIDTSNPVMFGMHKIKYNSQIEKNKLPDKMCDHMHDIISEDQWYYIESNIRLMKEWCE